MKVLSIDASTKASGIAVFQDTNLIYYECIQEHNSDTLERIQNMSQRIKQAYEAFKPTDVVMEQVLPQDVKHNQQVYKALIYLQAAVALKLHEVGHKKINLVPAAHWRSICKIKMGKGIKRDQLKQSSIALVKKIYNLDVNDDISDAICLGMAYIQQFF